MLYVQTSPPDRRRIMAWSAAATTRQVPRDLSHVVWEYAGFFRLELAGPTPTFMLRTAGLVKAERTSCRSARALYGATANQFHNWSLQAYRVPLFGHLELPDHADAASEVWLCPLADQQAAFLPAGCVGEGYGLGGVAGLALKLGDTRRTSVGATQVDTKPLPAPCGSRQSARVKVARTRQPPDLMQVDHLLLQFTLTTETRSRPGPGARLAVDVQGSSACGVVSMVTTKDGRPRPWALIAERASGIAHGRLVLG